MLIACSAVAAALVIGAAGAYWWWRTHHPAATTVAVNEGTATANPNVPGGNYSGAGPDASKGGSSSPTAVPAGTKPDLPTGAFVSNHSPNLSGHPAPNSETSTCTTTPGAQCQISFTQGSTSKSLPAKTADSSGHVIWTSWTLQQLGLTQGTWHIAAVARIGDNTATAHDINDLVVAP